ncbi:MAG: histidine kinase [Dermatophilaceae bacterium]
MLASRGSRAGAGLIAIGLDLLVWGGAVRTMSGSTVPAWVPVLGIVLGHQSLWFICHRPRLVLGVQVALGSVSLVVPRWQPFAGLLMAAYAATAAVGLGRIRLLLSGVGLVLLAHSYGSARLTAQPVSSTATLFALWLTVAGVAVGVGMRRRTLAHRAWHSTTLAADRAQRALLAERRRIARDLHDGLGGAVTAVHLHAATARALDGTADRPAAGSLAAIEAGAERSVLELRRVVGSLLPRPDHPTPSPADLLAEVPLLAKAARYAGLRVTLAGDWAEAGHHDLEPAAVSALVGTVQEGLTNALKYGPRGGGAILELRIGTRRLDLDVTSDLGRPERGRSSPSGPWSGGQGLQNLAERARLAGGWLRAGIDGGLFRVHLHLPLAPVLVP